MCFTFAGRLQTRLLSMIGPLMLAAVFVAITGERDYLALAGLMIAVLLLLDLGVYGWLIGFQPRWLSIVLAALEFWLVKTIVELPFPWSLALRTRQALVFYLLAWCLSWVTTQLILPLLVPRWAEDGGELRRWRHARAGRRGDLLWYRQSYAMALVLLGIGGLPWIVGALQASPGTRFTGLLVLEPAHLDALEIATATMRSPAPPSIAGLIGYLAWLGHWPILPVYWAVWACAGFLYLLGLRAFLHMASPWLIVALGLPPLVLPAPWLLLAAAAIWTVVLLPVDRPIQPGPRRVAHVGAALVLCGWLLLWTRLSTGPYAYVDEGTWQVLTWLRQSAPQHDVVVAPAPLSQLVAALSGHDVRDQAVAVREEQPVLVLATGAACDAETSLLFRYGQRCVAELTSGSQDR